MSSDELGDFDDDAGEDGGDEEPIIFHVPDEQLSPLWCPGCAEDVNREVEPLYEDDLEIFETASCVGCGETVWVNPDAEMTIVPDVDPANSVDGYRTDYGPHLPLDGSGALLEEYHEADADTHAVDREYLRALELLAFAMPIVDVTIVEHEAATKTVNEHGPVLYRGGDGD